MRKKTNKKPKILAVITARGGSKGLPGKNIIDLAGKPLITYTIEAALKSKHIDKVMVTTDDKKIAEISKKFGAEIPFIRPKYLARATTHSPPVVEHAVKFLQKKGEYYDLVLTLQPTSPLRKTKHIDEAINLINKSSFESVMSVKPVEFPPFWLVKIKNNRAVPIIDDGIDYFKKERQQLQKTYQPNGAVYVTRTNTLLNKHVIISKNCGITIMNNESSLDIDTAEDLEEIRKVIKNKK